MEFKPRNMPFRRLGVTGLRVPLFSLGGWLTIGGSVKGDPVKDIMKVAFENGINMFDTAEGYADGQCETEMGRVIKELGFRRSDIIVSTKIFWGGEGPNYVGLSRKHIVEGLRKSLDRLQLDYVDVVFAHRPDDTVPMEEIVRAFNWVIEKGWAFYWGTSEWSAREIEEAYHVSSKLGLIPPVAEQCKHHMFHRERAEKEYEPLYRKYQIGTTVFSALAQGLLTGKYNDGIPEDSRFAIEKDPQFIELRTRLQTAEGQDEIERIKKLTKFAEQELNCKVSHLALAWVALNSNTSTVILGASKPEQVLDNLKALEVIPKLAKNRHLLDVVEEIIGSKPTPHPTFGRPVLDGSLPSI